MTDEEDDAGRLGLWVFLSSEAMFFAALLLVCWIARVADPAGFAAGVASADRGLGTFNTLLLLTSSGLVALSTASLAQGRRGRAVAFVAGAVALGGAFLVVKGVEYAGHIDAGLLPRGVSPYWTLYWICTAVHAVHVAVGAGVLAVAGVGVARGGAGRALEGAALFWHFVDVVWIVLWPLFYLVRA